ncbi:MAG: polyamine aminopropyltransferase [Bacteriovoracaceae bacterium]|nr:polyamine aminopropyltransferase [Bacteriovoracaceae bacterium]
MKSSVWIEEIFEDFCGVKFKVERTLFSGKSEFQTVDVVETKGHGKMLLNDGLIMVTERDEFVYHDMISHVPLFVHPNPKSVLIIGGGDGGTAREVLRHSGLERIVQVEIDEMVVNACKEHIPSTACSYDNSKLELVIGDGVKFVKETKEKFDIILVDSTDPIGPAAPLFGPEFYKDIDNILSDDGIVVSQGESPFLLESVQKSMLKVLSEQFKVVKIYNFNNLTYPGGLWSFTFASKGLHPIQDFDPKRVDQSGLEFKYYNKELHTGTFAIPTFQQKNLEGLLKD